MKFGIREICEVVLRAKATQMLGNKKFYKNEPVLYFDSLKTTSLEGAANTVYATGGRGNTRLVAWEGERTLTFTMEDALISPESFSILSGAGLVDATEDKPIYVHTTSQIVLKEDNKIELPEKAAWSGYDADNELYHDAADIFIMEMKNGQIAEEPCIPSTVADSEGEDVHSVITCFGHNGKLAKGTVVIVDYYVKRTSGAQVIEITADKFGGNYYLEAATLFRDQQSGVDMPAEFIIPNCKIQSNFTFSMASSGDPSTFTFTMDAFPDYTKFDPTKKVLAAIQVVTEAIDDEDDKRQVCVEGEKTNFNQTASTSAAGATVKVTSDSDTAATITVTGSSVTSSYTEGTFNANDELDGVGALELNFNLPIKEAGLYHIKQTNPSLELYKTDSMIKEPTSGVWVKENDYNLTPDGDNTFQMIITEDNNDKNTTVVLSKGGKTVKTYVIKVNDLTFAD